jgi:uncharacterized protein (DUF1800 family)
MPRPAGALDVAEATHLLARSGFAATPPEATALAGASRSDAVAVLLRKAAARAAAGPVTPLPAWHADWAPPRPQEMTPEARALLREATLQQALDLKAWWLREMRDTAAPLLEVMTLFWHSHFTSSLAKVKAPALLLRQNQLLRRHALGNFSTLLHKIARDPAMLLYLDNAHSRREEPNENFARELLELFTLGEGHYSEADIKATARAFTGWSVSLDTGDFVFRPRLHDSGAKTLLGRHGTFDGDDVIDVLLAQPQTAELIVSKLWRHFISEAPDLVEVKRLAELFRSSGYEILPLLQALFTSEAFWAEENRGRLVKSPVDFVVGSLRLFDLPVQREADLAWITRHLGQDLFDPPNVKGWPGGTAWITGTTLLDRQLLIARISGNLTSGMADGPGAGERRRAAFFDRWVESLPAEWQSAEALTQLVLALPPVDSPVLDRRASGALLRSLIADPVYQLK